MAPGLLDVCRGGGLQVAVEPDDLVFEKNQALAAPAIGIAAVHRIMITPEFAFIRFWPIRCCVCRNEHFVYRHAHLNLPGDDVVAKVISEVVTRIVRCGRLASV